MKMLGTLPRALDVNGVKREIRPDYLNIFRIFEILEATDLAEHEKTYLFLRRIYKGFTTIPSEDYQAAAEAAIRFIEAGEGGQNKKKSPRVIYWGKDEQMLFAAVNAVAGFEVRLHPETHWWTWLGFFQNIDPGSPYGFILNIRSKKKRGKKLEKYEREFYRTHIALIEEQTPEEKKQSAYDYMDALYAELRAEQGGE